MANEPNETTPQNITTRKAWYESAIKPLWLFLIMILVYSGLTYTLSSINEQVSTSLALHEIITLFLSLLITVLVSYLSVLLIFRVILKYPYSETPLFHKPMVEEIGRGFAFGFFIFSSVVFVSWLIGIYSIQGFYWDTHSPKDTILFFVQNLILFLIVGIREEVLFRAGLFHLFEEKGGTWSAMIISSFFFGFAHANNPEATVLGVVGIMFEAGILFGALYVTTRRIWFVAGLHWAWNFTQGPIFGNIISGSTKTQPGIFMGHMNGQDYLTGGIFGPEGGLVAISICTFFGVFFFLKSKREGYFKTSIFKQVRKTKP